MRAQTGIKGVSVSAIAAQRCAAVAPFDSEKP